MSTIQIARIKARIRRLDYLRNYYRNNGVMIPWGSKMEEEAEQQIFRALDPFMLDYIRTHGELSLSAASMREFKQATGIPTTYTRAAIDRLFWHRRIGMRGCGEGWTHATSVVRRSSELEQGINKFCNTFDIPADTAAGMVRHSLAA